MFSSVLIAIDGLEFTTKLLDLARRVCTSNTRVLIIYVDTSYVGQVQNVSYIPNSTDLMTTANNKQVMLDALRYFKLTKDLDAEGVIVGGDTAEVIVKQAKKMNSDLIIMGHRHLSKLNRFFDPSVTIEVVKKAHCPVLVDSLN